MGSNIPFPLNQYAEWLERSIQDGARCQALRWGDNQRAAGKAIQLIAPWVKNNMHLEVPLLLSASAIAQTKIRNSKGTGFGTTARIAGRFFSEDSADAKILAMYNQPLERAHTYIVSFLRIAQTNNIPTDYEKLIRMYLYWDKEPYEPRSVRRRMLNDYFGANPKENNNQSTNPEGEN